MIVALRGRLARWDEDTSALWIETGGVTYEVLIPGYAREWIGSRSRSPDAEFEIYTYQHATDRQPVPMLFGFPSLQERDFFRKFIEVPDVGPTKAVRALTYPVPEIARWIETEDARALRQLPGIGERLASTIVAHMRGKVVAEALLRGGPDASGEPVATRDVRDDAVEALVGLQYQEREAETLVRAVMLADAELDTLEDVLRAVLAQQAD